jgi:hypothetical protein
MEFPTQNNCINVHEWNIDNKWNASGHMIKLFNNGWNYKNMDAIDHVQAFCRGEWTKWMNFENKDEIHYESQG